jgi:hypothetical protein
LGHASHIGRAERFFDGSKIGAVEGRDLRVEEVEAELIVPICVGKLERAA